MTANPPSKRKSYGTSHVRPPRRLFALTSEAQDFLTSCGIATPGIDQSENEEGQTDGNRTTNGDTHDEDVRELGPDA